MPLTEWLATRRPTTPPTAADATPATHSIDGTTYDLTRSHLDTLAVAWTWTGERTPGGEPLMTSGDPGLLTLHDVHHWHGPLVPVTRRTTPDYWDAA